MTTTPRDAQTTKPRTINDFARELALKLDPYLAIGMRAQDIEWIIVEAMQAEMRKR